VTSWNCHPRETLPIDLTFTERKREQSTDRTSSERESEEFVRIKLETEGRAGVPDVFLATAKAESEFTKRIKRRFESSLERLVEHERNEQRTTSFKIAPLTSVESGVSAVNVTQEFRLRGSVVYDAEVSIALPGTLGPAPIGRLADFLPEADRLVPLDARVLLTREVVSWVGMANVRKYGTADECDEKQLAEEAFGQRLASKIGFASSGAVLAAEQGSAQFRASFSGEAESVRLPRLDIAALAVAASSERDTLRPQQCRASLRGDASLSGTNARVRHSVRVACGASKFKSSGRASFDMKVELDNGRSETLTGFAVAWRNEQGDSFSVSDSERINLRGVVRVLEVLRYHVDTCSCQPD
jgi:hypothetical protein